MGLAASFRSLRRQPWFSLAAIAILSLGLAATTVVFSVVETVLIRPLPYRDADRLLFVWQELRARGFSHFTFSHGEYADLQHSSPSMSGVAALTTGEQTLLHDDGTPEIVTVGEASANLFDVLGVSTRFGPGFAGSTGNPGGASAPATVAKTAVISDAAWQRLFGGRDVLGKTLRLDGGTAVIAGVLPEDFELLAVPDADLASRPDVWLSLGNDFTGGQRAFAPFCVIGRLKDGSTIAEARRDVAALTADFRARFPVKRTADVHVVVAQLRDDVVAATRPTLLVLLAAVMLVLLVSCTNVAGLMLAKVDRRAREVAVRMALGGSRRQILQQLVTESLLLAGAAALVALAIAEGALRLLRAYGPAQVPRLATAGLDLTVLGVALIAALVSAVVVGVMPTLRAPRTDLAGSLRQGGRGGSGRHPLRALLVGGEIAMSLVLLIAAGLMLRSLMAIQATDPGFDASGVYTFAVPRPLGDGPARAARAREFRERLSALPGVVAVSAASGLPLDGESFTGPYGPLDAATRPELMRQAEHRFIDRGFFQTLRTPFIEGRDFTDSDAGRRVVIVDSTLASLLFPGQPAVGQQILVPRVQAVQQPEPFEIIGVVRAQASTEAFRPGRETLYVPATFVNWSRITQWVVRTDASADALAGPVREAARAFDAGLALSGERPFASLVTAALAPTRFVLALLSAFSTIALILAAVGLYGVLATIVEERTVELGIRLALGAERRGVFTLVLREGLMLAGVGIVAGVLFAIAMGSALRAVIVGVEPADPLTLSVVTLSFLAVVVAACVLPAMRGARVDPVIALRAGH